ncbi:MAG: cell division protein [Gammaproteobacteria bacterium]|nr:cell division protein [Gammaproteobacteria bacterium]
MNNQTGVRSYPARRRLLIGCFMAFTALMLWRVVELHVIRNEFLRNHGDSRSIREVEIHAHRGAIVDRNLEPLAISTPVVTVGAVPRKILTEEASIPRLAAALEMDTLELKQLLSDRIARDLIYLKRHITPDQGDYIQELNIQGVHLQREYKRYYPAGEVTAHLIGFTNVDDAGQEGLELAYNDWLQGTSGLKRVLKDSLGRTVQDIESIQASEPGKQLVLSIDRRVQYLAYRELAAAVSRHKAKGGTLVMLDAKSGEVMAMVGQPSYNPNNRNDLKGELYRNRAVTDIFEPGSTIKPFTIAAALESGLYQVDSRIDTSPGFLRVNKYTIRENEDHNYGVIDLAEVISKSSNIGASKIALSLGPERIWDMFSRFGIGTITGSGYPGESSGLFNNYRVWSEADLATIAFGHGVAVTTLQLAQAYAILAAGGSQRPISFIKLNEPVAGTQILSKHIAEQIKFMMEGVTQEGGTGTKAKVEGYRVAGKTGTARKSTAGGYSLNHFRSLFAGFAPISDPRLVLVVMIDEPEGGQYYGGLVAAPVFAEVMKGALRILNIPPDDPGSMSGQVIMAQNRADFPGTQR